MGIDDYTKKRMRVRSSRFPKHSSGCDGGMDMQNLDGLSKGYGELDAQKIHKKHGSQLNYKKAQ